MDSLHWRRELSRLVVGRIVLEFVLGSPLGMVFSAFIQVRKVNVAAEMSGWK